MTTDIDEIERLLAAATPEDEWFVVRYGDGDSLVICRDEAGNQRIAFMAVPGTRDHLARNRTWKAIKANAALIVAARNSLPAMLTEIRELRAENARLRDDLRRAESEEVVAHCEGCSAPLLSNDDFVADDDCVHGCFAAMTDAQPRRDWPCYAYRVGKQSAARAALGEPQ